MAASRSSSWIKAFSLARHFSAAALSRRGTPSSAVPAGLSTLQTSAPSRPPAHNFGHVQNYHHHLLQQLQCVSCLVQKHWPVMVAKRGMVSNKLKRRKEMPFDRIIQREKKVKIMRKIRSILLKQNGKNMTLLLLGKYRYDIGLTGKRRLIVLLHRYPGVFETYEESGNVSYVRFTAAALEQWETELLLRKELESSLVDKVRKMLMISVEKKLTMDKIAHYKHDFGLPEDFQTNLLLRYPHLVKVTSAENAGTAFALVELTSWDPLLAVSVAEKKASSGSVSALVDERPKIIIDGEELRPTAPGVRTLNFPKGLNLNRKERARALQYHDIPFISPYTDRKNLDLTSTEFEKLACATVHELLSLTVEKRTLVDHLTHLRKDYMFPKSIRATIIRHPDIFYVSFVGKRDTVFLREAYTGSELKAKDPLVLSKERLRELSEIRPERKVRSKNASGEPEGDDSHDESEQEDDSDFDSNSANREYGDKPKLYNSASDSDRDLGDDDEYEDCEDEGSVIKRKQITPFTAS